MRTAAPLAAVVLVGGASRRMGRDKATLPYRGATLVEHVTAVAARRCDPVFVVAAGDQVLPDLPARVLRDERGGVGPLLATGRGLRAAADAGLARAFVCAVDMPNLTAAFVDDLAAGPVADVVLPYDGRDHYLAAIYATALHARVTALVDAGERSMRALIDAVATRRVEMAPSPLLANVNTAAAMAEHARQVVAPHPVRRAARPRPGDARGTTG